MKAYKIIIVLLILLSLVQRVYAQQNPINTGNSIISGGKKSLLELLNVEQFRGLSYTEFIKHYPNFWLYSMDYDNNNSPRRIMKAPAKWTVNINGLTFKNLVVIFLNNQVEQIILSTDSKVKNIFSVKDFINEAIRNFKGAIVKENKKKIVVRLNDKFKTEFECYFPLSYYEPDINIYISMQ